ncbi:MAG: hypothetical protein ACJ760_16055 [Thermoleophilaceae bacterium]
MNANPQQVHDFVAFSAAVTGFREFDLHGTGQAEEYLSTVAGGAGADVLDGLLAAWTRVRDEAQDDDTLTATLLRREVFSDPTLGPVARNVVKLWYVGIWYELPRAWIDACGALERNYTFMVSSSAYVNGMLWTAIGGNPPGARGPGFASWAGPPRFPADTP